MIDPVAKLTQTILDATDAARTEAWGVGKVTAVTPRAGFALATVEWRGGSYQVPYLSSYSPAVGDVVLLARPTDQLVIVGRIVGTP